MHPSFRVSGLPQIIRVDNGKEFHSLALTESLAKALAAFGADLAPRRADVSEPCKAQSPPGPRSAVSAR